MNSPLALAERIEALETLLKLHHEWHLQAGTIGLQDGNGGWIEIDNAAEYADSSMCERTQAALANLPPDEMQPTPRGGLTAWWWSAWVLERRKRRKLEKVLKPFADACERADKTAAEVERARMGKLGDSATIGWGIRYEHVKAARTALSAQTDGGR